MEVGEDPAAGLQHPGAQFDDEAGGFRQGDELVRRHHAALGMPPPQQRLASCQLAAGIVLGLDLHEQLLRADGRVQVLLQRQAFVETRQHVLLEENRVVAALRLGPAQGELRFAQRVEAAGRIGVDEADARTGADAQGALADVERRGQAVEQLGRDTFHQVAGIVVDTAFRAQHHDEFVAAGARQDVPTPQDALQPACGFASTSSPTWVPWATLSS